MALRKVIACLLGSLVILTAFAGCGKTEQQTEALQYNTIEDLAGKRIGVVTGMILDRIAEKNIPDCQLSYFTNYADTAKALSAGKIDAFLADEPIARKLVLSHPEQSIMTKIMDDSYGFIFPKDDAHKKLCKEMNTFLSQIRKDGTLREIDDIWFGSDESVQVIDRTKLTGENGTIQLVTSTNAGEPFVYVKNGECVGYEMDILCRFCHANGYALETVDSNFDGIIASISTGKGDIGASCISITDERKESMLFSDSHYSGGVVIVVGKGTPQTQETPIYKSAAELAGKNIGVLTGTIFDVMAQKNIPDAVLTYYNADPDLPVALETGKIDAYLADEPIFRSFSQEYDSQYIVEKISNEEYSYILPKNNKKCEKIRAELNEFLDKAANDGTMDAVAKKWLSGDAENATIDYSDLTGENGTIRFATSSENGMFFDTRLDDGTYGGYDIELLVLFCREYGYALEITDYNFSGVIAAISSGKEDIAACTISVTEERKESMLFSNPNYHGGIVVVSKRNEAGNVLTMEDMKDKRIGVMTGSVFDKVAEEKVPGNKVEYLNTMSDMPTALQTGKIDAYLADEPVYRSIIRNYPEEYIIEQLTHEEYAFIFPKNSEKHKKICNELNSFLAESWNNGTMDEICDKWINGDYTKASIDFDSLTGENGTLKMAISSEIGAPFTFIQNNNFAGYDVEVAVRFCKKYGYALEIKDYSISGFLSATSTGNADLAAGCVSITKERQESMLFSEPNYHGGIVLVGMHTLASDVNESNIFADIKESFRKTFIRESRWQMFLDGICITLIITALSVVLGSVLGFLIFLIYRKKFKPFVVFVDIIKDILEKTPVVVILMILYYVVFGKAELSGVLVSVIGFTLIFAFSLVETLQVGVNAVDKGQSEAFLAMGFTDLQGFFKVILPQAAKHFLPGYRGQIVSLLKSTAIVGYIAVQDLTKISDIIRSRTYEAFFPLIATAVLYFLLAWLLTLLVRSIEIRTDTSKRSKKKILRGVKQNDSN